jgi:hypothetical protein
MTCQVTQGDTIAAASDGTRYSSELTEQLLASEHSVLRLITRNTPLPELLDEVCRYSEALLGEGSSCSILLLDEDGIHARAGGAHSLPKSYTAALDGAVIGPQVGSCGTAMYLRHGRGGGHRNGSALGGLQASRVADWLARMLVDSVRER